MGHHLKTNFSKTFFFLLLLLSLLPQNGISGGELSGGGIEYFPVGYQFRTAGDARVAFNQIESGAKAYWNPNFGKAIPYVRVVKGSKDRFLADSELCIDGDKIRSTIPGPNSGEFLNQPIQWQEMDCVRWRVKVKDANLDRVFSSRESADYFVRDNEKAIGEPYCRDDEWQLMTKSASISYFAKFYANVRGEKEPVRVGQIHYRFFNCDQLERIASIQDSYYQDFVTERTNDRSQWIQMAGGELSGGGKPKKAN